MASSESQVLGNENPQLKGSMQKPSLLSMKNAGLAGTAAVGLIALYGLSQWSYLLFHVSVEVFTIVIAIATFAVAWSSRRLVDNNYLLIIGIAFLFVGGLDLMHTLAYKGMNVIPGVGNQPNVATQLWIATRYVLSFSLLIPLFFTRRKVRSSVVFAAYSATVLVLTASIFVWQNFPVAYDTQLTDFKVGSEYVISAIIAVATGVLYLKRKEFSQSIFSMLVGAMILTVASELAFTLYTDVFGIANMLGHVLNVLAFYFIYRALVETGIKKPYELLFRNLKQSETNLENRNTELLQINARLENEITEREAIEDALRETQEQLQMKLDSVLLPDIEISEHDLKNILDVPALQDIMDDLYAVDNMAFALVDLKGNVLVSTGWQDICLKFHRVNPQTCKNCTESDLELSSGVKLGEIRLYKCKNNMWDVVTPLIIGGKHAANVFFGQFFFEDEKIDKDLFAAQAKKYGFDKKEYLAAFDRVPKFSREKIENLMKFYSKWSQLVSKLSFGNLKLAKSLAIQRDLREKLENKAAEVEEYASQMEELAEERLKKLRDSERLVAIGQTAGMVGHDIRNPLQAIISELYLAKIDAGLISDVEAKQNLTESISNIEKNIVYINKIVADLQDFARPLNPKPEKIQIEPALREALATVNNPENVTTTVTIDKELTVLNTDPTMLKRVLTNLVQNAVQAMPQGGILTLEASRKRNRAVITVADTGEGIPEEAKSKLFTPLFTTKSKGQGFGLAVVKRLVEVQGGEISFESQHGKGTKFIVQLPF